MPARPVPDGSASSSQATRKLTRPASRAAPARPNASSSPAPSRGTAKTASYATATTRSSSP